MHLGIAPAESSGAERTSMSALRQSLSESRQFLRAAWRLVSTGSTSVWRAGLVSTGSTSVFDGLDQRVSRGLTSVYRGA